MGEIPEGRNKSTQNTSYVSYVYTLIPWGLWGSVSLFLSLSLAFCALLVSSYNDVLHPVRIVEIRTDAMTNFLVPLGLRIIPWEFVIIGLPLQFRSYPSFAFLTSFFD